MPGPVKLPPIEWGESQNELVPAFGAKSAGRRVSAKFVSVFPDKDVVPDATDVSDAFVQLAKVRLQQVGGAFNLSDQILQAGSDAPDGASRLRVVDGAQELEVFRGSGSWRWAILASEADPPDLPATAPPDPTAAADAFLKQRGLYDDRARPVRVHSTVVTAPGPDGQLTSFPTETHVDYQYWIDGLPVFGPGAKIRVTFDHKAEPVRALKFWREPSRTQIEAPMMQLVQSKEHVRKRLRRDEPFAHMKKRVHLRVRRVRLGYYAAPPREVQGGLVAVFACDCTASMPGLPRYDYVRYVHAFETRAKEWQSLGPTLRKHLLR